MSNLSMEVERIEKYVKQGMEDGAEPVIRSLKFLFGRINELEGALLPFARAGVQPSDGKPLIQVYHKDCQRAVNVLSHKMAAAAESARPKEEYLPAEY